MRIVSKFTLSLLVLSLAVPASAAAASPAGADEPSVVARAVAVGPNAPASPASALSPAALRAAIARASVAIPREQGVQAPVHNRTKPRLVRGQGGGKTAMITTLVATVGGLIGTIYMIDYMKKQSEQSTTGS